MTVNTTRGYGSNVATTQRTVIALFDDSGHAERALTELQRTGLDARQVSVIARDARETRQIADHTDANVNSGGREAGGIFGGAALGGIGGGALGWLVGISAWVIPGIGPLVGTGTLAATIAGAVAGAVGGGLGGALINVGVPEGEARNYETRIKEGSILVAVSATEDQIGAVRGILERQGGHDVKDFG